MNSAVYVSAPRSPLLLAGRRLAVLVVLMLSGCSANLSSQRLVSQLPPLQVEDRIVEVKEVATRAPTPELLALDPQMIEFVQRYTQGMGNARQRLLVLHRAISGSATLGIEYDPLAGGSAIEVFHRGSANCLSYASLFVALAREAGLDARYQWLDVRPQWTRQGERLIVRLHVNTVVELGRTRQFMVDIDPLEPRDIAGSSRLSDDDASALHHSNIAMQALAANDPEQAWLHSVRALQLSPAMAHLWVNLGAIYRVVGQYREAESSYYQALHLDPLEQSAMNNLAVLYNIENRQEDRDYWERQVTRYREKNPYYYAWLAEQAYKDGDWQSAVDFYDTALELAPADSSLLRALALTYVELGETELAVGYLQRAIDAATLRSDTMLYRRELESLRGGHQPGRQGSIRM